MNRVKFFNFKVLELKTVDDFKEDGDNDKCDRVRELFNFDFPLVLPSDMLPSAADEKDS